MAAGTLPEIATDAAVLRGVIVRMSTSTNCEMASDGVLIASALGGAQDAFSDLMARHERGIYVLAYRRLGDAHDARDATQETFLRAYLHLATYSPSRPFRVWLSAIARNWCIDQRRRQRAARLDEHEDVLRCAPAEDEPEQATLEAEQQRTIRRWVGQLPETYRQPLELHYFHGLSCREIGIALGTPVSTIRMRLYRARRYLARTGHPDEVANHCQDKQLR